MLHALAWRCITPRGVASARNFRAATVLTHQRGLKKGKALKKPRYRIKLDSDGNIIPPETIIGYTSDEVDDFKKWLTKRASIAKKSLGSGISERFREEVNKEIVDYFSTKWGVRMAEIKARARKKRALKRKRRRNELWMAKIAEWNKLEDAKDNKVLRDKARELRQLSRERFSFRSFLSEQREKLRPVYKVETEAEFLERLKQDTRNFLYYKPRCIRKKERRPLNYDKRLCRDVVMPWLIEVRRRARISQLVKQREEALGLIKWREETEKRRQAKIKARQEAYMEKQRHWSVVLGNWHEHNNTVRFLKAKYMRERELTFQESRMEFLDVISRHLHKFVETPSECRFMRFRFAPGVTMPRNKSHYMS